MVNKKNTILYPFDSESVSILRHSMLVVDNDIVGLVSPNGWGFNLKDASCADNGKHIGVIIQDNFENMLEECNTLMLTDSFIHLDYERVLLPKLNKAIQKKKNILCTLNLSKKMINKIAQDCEDNGASFKHYGLTLDSNSYCNYPKIEKEFIYDIKTPIVFVFGIAERTYKFEIQLSIREELLKMGYKVSQVGSRNYCELMGFHSFPDFMYSNSIIESNKVVLFNHFIKKIEVEENPDIIIIGIPGGIMPFNNKFTNRFGILAYQVSQAVTPDYSIFSVLFEDYFPEFFENISKMVRYRLGFDIDSFNLGNVIFDGVKSDLEDKMIYTMIDCKIIDKKKEELNRIKDNIYNILNGNDAISIANNIIYKLGEYGAMEVI